MAIAFSDVRFRGQSGHGRGLMRCPLLTQSGYRRIKIAAVQLSPLSAISVAANPCCNRSLETIAGSATARYTTSNELDQR
jgi:hypothetical protein